MLKEAIEKIASMAEPRIIQVGGKNYSTGKLFPALMPIPEPLKVTTLTGIKDYLTHDPDAILSSGDDVLIIHVNSHSAVTVHGTLIGSFEQRKTYLRAELQAVQSFNFGQYYQPEDFIVGLQAFFIPDETTAAILSIVGNIKDSIVASYSDDGVSQAVKIRQGVQRVENTPVPNPVLLRPYRTFREIDQPASRFLLRMRSGASSDSPPTIALFETDGGEWRLQAISRIRDWLAENTEKITIIA